MQTSILPTRSMSRVLPRLLAAALVAVPLSAAGAHGTAHAAGQPAQAAASAAMANQPMRFEPNVGQVAGHAPFVARAPYTTTTIAADRATFTLFQPRTPSLNRAHRAAAGGIAATATLTMRFVGANARAGVAGLDRLPGITNYFVGRSAAQWHTGLHAYGRVRVANLYPGIDVVYHGLGTRLEYDFALAPHANPNLIQIRFDGAQGIQIDHAGNLLLHLRGGVLREAAPRVTQDGTAVAGRFVLLGSGAVGFRLGRYDTSRPLLIDPTVIYATYLGGGGFESGYSVATDGLGNIYLDGVAYGFPGTAAEKLADPDTTNTVEETFIAKLQPLGGGGADLVYFDYIGGKTGDSFIFDGLTIGGNSIALDSAGDAYIAGTTYAADLPIPAGVFGSTLNQGTATTVGASDAFMATINASGSALRYAAYIGGSDNDAGNSIAVDAAGNAYVVGESVQSAKTGTLGLHLFYTTNGTVPNTTNALGFYDAFLTEITPNPALTPASSQVPFSTLLGGGFSDFGTAVALDHAKNVLVGGYTLSNDFPGTATGYQTTNLSGANVNYVGFVAKVNPLTSTALTPDVAATYLGGSTADTILLGLAVDAKNNVDVAGLTADSTFPTTAGAYLGTFNAANTTENEGFVSQLSPNLNALTYSTFFYTTSAVNGVSGNTNDLEIYALAVDAVGTIYVTGFASDTIPTAGMPLTPVATPTTPGGAFLAEFLPNPLIPAAQTLAYATLLSGNGGDDGTGAGTVTAGDEGYGVAVDANGIVYVVGQYLRSNTFLPVTAGAFQTAFGGLSDAFAIKFLPIPNPSPFCTVSVALRVGTTNLGFTAASRPPLAPPFPVSFFTYQTGPSIFTARFVSLSCIRPGLPTAIVTVTGTASTAHGIFHMGDAVKGVLTLNPLLSGTGASPFPTMTVQDLTIGYSNTLTGPFTRFQFTVIILPS